MRMSEQERRTNSDRLHKTLSTDPQYQHWQGLAENSTDLASAKVAYKRQYGRYWQIYSSINKKQS